MDKKFLVFSFVFILVIAGLIFVLAVDPGIPTALKFTNNVTSLYDEGNFTVNWTNGTASNATHYNITIWVDNVVWITDGDNDSLTGYRFNNYTEANYTFAIAGWNSTHQGVNSSNISMYVDRTAPVITLPVYTNATLKKNTENLTLNISVIDAKSGETGSVCLIDVNGTSNQSVAVISGWCNNSVINLTGSTDGNHTLRIYVNDTVNNLGLNNSYAVQIDTTAPSVSLSASSATTDSLTISISGVDGTCTVDRSGASISGSTLTETGLSCGYSYAYVVTCTDSAGNAGSSSSTSFSTSGCGGGVSSTTPPKETHSWTKITPGVAAIMKDFDEEIGIKQISLEVNNEAQNVRITVAKYDGKPANVSVEKSGKIYKYLHINAENLEDKLSKATIRIQVEKFWVSDEEIDLDKVVLFKFDENNNVWEELVTSYKEADDEYYYYDAEVDSFSYFAISEKAVVSEEDGEEEELEREGIGGWWIAIIAGVIIVAYLVSANKKKISKLLKK